MRGLQIKPSVNQNQADLQTRFMSVRPKKCYIYDDGFHCRTRSRRNQLDHLGAFQKRRLLERAVITIREMREAIGMTNGTGRDVALDIHTTALSIEKGWRADDQVRDAFLTATTMIRDLHIILDSKTSIRIAPLAR
ncbi:hypothetical protein [Agrobacterium vitis]|uniref:hypothetical protein n=1 Tax=Agrobacterium vitis TaxID=373 RepID=UPI001F22AABB|nr:hypothetical protein [Agrobacterium vitis]